MSDSDARDRLIEVMARARADQACGAGYFDSLKRGEQHMRSAYEGVVLDALLSAENGTLLEELVSASKETPRDH